jgi:hypothetical protein
LLARNGDAASDVRAASKADTLTACRAVPAIDFCSPGTSLF